MPLVRAFASLALLGVLTGAAPSAPATTFPSVPTAVSSMTSDAMALDSMSPVVAPDSPWSVSASIPLTQAGERLEVHVRSGALTTRSALEVWSSARPEGALGRLAASAEFLPDAGVARARVEVSADDLTLPSAATSWGPRAVSLVRTSRDGVRLEVVRTFLVWYPASSARQFDPTALSVVVPIVAPQVDPATGRVPDEVMDQAVRGPLRAALELASTPGWSWALDPALLASSEDPLDAVEEPSATPGSSRSASGSEAPDRLLEVGLASPSDATLAWREDLLAAAVGRSVNALPYADAAPSGSPALDSAAWEESAAVLETAGVSTDTALVLPDGSGTLPDLASLADQSLVLPAAAQRLSGGNATPSAATSVPRDGSAQAPGATTPDALRAVVTDEVLQEVVTDPVDATRSARLVAETAALTRERPYDARHVVLVLPRSWASDADVTTLSAALSTPWLSVEGLGSALRSTPDLVERAPLDAPIAQAGPGVLEASAALEGLEAFSSALSDPSTLASARRRAASVQTRSSGAPDRVRAAAALTDLLEAVPAAVSVPSGSVVNLAASEASLPVPVANGLDQEVTVELSASTTSPRLRASGGGVVVVPAMRSTIAEVDLVSLAPGDTAVVLNLSSPDGPVSSSTEVRVRGLAQWGWVLTAGMLAAAGLFVVGLVRAVLRKRRTGRSRDFAPPEPIQEDPEAGDADRGTTEATAGTTGETPESAAGAADRVREVQEDDGETSPSA